MNVHCLVTVLNPERLNAALLVFKTIRRGFPSAHIYVYGNGLESPMGDQSALALLRAAIAVNAEYRSIETNSHGEWLEKLLDSEQEPFWVVDSDVVFCERVEHWFDRANDILFAGRYEPEFWEEWTETVHVSRLHPSLMWFNTSPLRAAMRGWPGKHQFFNMVQSNLIQWNWVPEHGKLKFYDTCAGLHHALGGYRFSEEQNKAFGHVFCGSYAHLIGQHHPNLEARHAAIFENPELARDMWQEQQQWYKENHENKKH